MSTIFSGLDKAATNGLRGLLPDVMDQGAVQACSELLWELVRRGDSTDWLDAQAGFYGGPFAQLLDKVRRVQRAGRNLEDLDTNYYSDDPL